MIKEQDGQIIVNELRPMSEFPKHAWNNVPHICYTTGINNGAPEYTPVLVVWNPKLHELCDATYSDEIFQNYMFLGWIPMPIYKPKETASCQDAVNMGLKA